MVRLILGREQFLLIWAGAVVALTAAAVVILSFAGPGPGQAVPDVTSGVSLSLPALGAMLGGANRLAPIYEVARPDKKLSLTVNAAGGYRALQEILEILSRHGVRATFFLTGQWMEEHPSLVKQMVQAGHEIGNHSFTHPHLGVLGESDLYYEIATADAIIKELTGERSRVFRPPFGEYNSQLMKAAYQLGYHVVMWSTNTYDWRDPEVTYIVRRIVEGARPGAIILLNANGRNTPAALDSAIPLLRQRGFEFVPVGELVYYEDYFVEPNTGVQRPLPDRPGAPNPAPGKQEKTVAPK